eukprot:GILJ01002053.1.p1 GENE.GILJ01002053.1~~GILJ01002053.1.p1  ORF type:complete len:351 (+),score=28.51 GILJ01002053.1:730-1782(+)
MDNRPCFPFLIEQCASTACRRPHLALEDLSDAGRRAFQNWKSHRAVDSDTAGVRGFRPRASHQPRLRSFQPRAGGSRTGRPSFGVVPWLKVNSELYCITQLSYSNSAYDVKLDPFRGGKANEQEEAFAAACREFKEESATLFNIELLDTDQMDEDGLYHVAFLFQHEDLTHIVADYDTNRRLDADGETEGIAITKPRDMSRTSSPRISFQLERMLKRTVPPFPLPLFEMQRHNNAPRVSYVGTRCELVHDLTALPNVTIDIPSSLWQYSDAARDVQARDRINDLIWRCRKAQIQRYPDEHEAAIVIKCVEDAARQLEIRVPTDRLRLTIEDSIRNAKKEALLPQFAAFTL